MTIASSLTTSTLLEQPFSHTSDIFILPADSTKYDCNAPAPSANISHNPPETPYATSLTSLLPVTICSSRARVPGLDVVQTAGSGPARIAFDFHSDLCAVGI